jgi:1-acyl-sn-glycerol-3-phosphate acyltransferase
MRRVLASLSLLAACAATLPAHGRPASRGSPCVSWPLAPLAYAVGDRVLLPAQFARRVEGLEKLPRDGTVILAPTHRARWDALLVGVEASKRRGSRTMRYMTTHTEMKGLQGWAIRQAGGFAIDQRHPRDGLAVAARELSASKARTLVIFPEGRIYRNGRLGELHQGLARLALTAMDERPGRPIYIVPVDLAYSDPARARGSRVTIRFGQALPAERFLPAFRDDKKAGAAVLTASLRQALESLGMAR